MKNIHFIAAAFWIVIGMSIANQILVVPTLPVVFKVIFLVASVPCQIILLAISLCLFDKPQAFFNRLNVWLGNPVK